jgi:hypothetical protein
MSLEKFPLGDLEAFCESLIRDCPDRGNCCPVQDSFTFALNHH